MSLKKPCGMGAVAGLVLLGLMGTHSAGAAATADCNARLTVELTPDVPDTSDVGFLSSLLNNQTAYHLELRQKIDPSLLELELSGPGPGYLCLRVIQTMRRDARIVSIHVDPAESPSAPAAGSPGIPDESSSVAISGSGIGSLYWAAHHARHAWRVLLPVSE